MNNNDAISAPTQAHSKTEYKRLVAQGANVLPPSKGMKIELTPGQIHFEFENIGYGLFWSEQTAATKDRHERIAAAVIAHVRPQIEAEARAKAILEAANKAVEVFDTKNTPHWTDIANAIQSLATLSRGIV
jgi:hypothetical protein